MKVESGDTVVVLYNGFLADGEIFESSETSGPLEFEVGSNSVLPEFESSIIGLKQGTKTSFTLPPEKAHGLSKPELIQQVPRANLPNPSELAIGMVLGMTIDKDGQKHKVPALVTALNDENATVDFNHPLAGKTLRYDVTLQSITKPKK